MGGCGSKATPLPADAIPAYCIKNASLDSVTITTVRTSWKRCMEGTAAHKAARLEKAGTLTSTGTKTTGTESSTTKTGSGSQTSEDDGAGTYSPIVFFYDCFYARLFEVAPGIRPLFRESLKVQGRALVKMIDVAVRMVDDVPTLVPALQDLAKRHVKYGARVPHYSVVGECLLHTLQKCMGEEYTPEVATAWLTVYSVMMSVMIPVAWEEEQRVAKEKAGGGGMCGGKSTAAVQPAPAPAPAAPVSPVKAVADGSSESTMRKPAASSPSPAPVPVPVTPAAGEGEASPIPVTPAEETPAP